MMVSPLIVYYKRMQEASNHLGEVTCINYLPLLHDLSHDSSEIFGGEAREESPPYILVYILVCTFRREINWL